MKLCFLQERSRITDLARHWCSARYCLALCQWITDRMGDKPIQPIIQPVTIEYNAKLNNRPFSYTVKYIRLNFIHEVHSVSPTFSSLCLSLRVNGFVNGNWSVVHKSFGRPHCKLKRKWNLRHSKHTLRCEQTFNSFTTNRRISA